MLSRDEIDRLFDDTASILDRVPTASEFRKMNEGAYRCIIDGKYSSDIKRWYDYLAHRSILDGYLPVKELARETECDPLLIYDCVRRNLLDVFRVGRQIYVSKWLSLESVAKLTDLDYSYIRKLLTNGDRNIYPVMIMHVNGMETFNIGLPAVKRIVWIAYKQDSLNSRVGKALFSELDEKWINLSKAAKMVGLTREAMRQHKHLKRRKGPGKSVLVKLDDVTNCFSGLSKYVSLVSIDRLKFILGIDDLDEEILYELGAESISIGSGAKLFTRKSLRKVLPQLIYYRM